jgi:hypothetical protein
LQISVGAVFLVKEEARIVDFFAEAGKADEVALVASFEVVVLQQLLVMKVSVLGLDRIKLVAERQVVFVSLLDLKYFCL